jgi:hypothetical protein
MKKTHTKLQLKKSTVRILQEDELPGVNGGGVIGIPREPTNQATQCSTSLECGHHPATYH